MKEVVASDAFPDELSPRREFPRVWNVCVGHSPRNAGLYRGINDFSSTLSAPILSFGDGEDGALASDVVTEATHQIPCGTVWPWRSAHLIGADAVRKAEQLLTEAAVVIVHSLFRGHADFVTRFAARESREYWVVPHGCLDPWGLAQRRLAKRLWMATVGDRLLANAAGVIFATSRERDKALGSGATLKPVVVPWPVTAPALQLQDCERNTWRAMLGATAEERVLLAVSRLHEMKRPDALIKAFVAASPPRCHLVLAGGDDGVSRATLQKTIKGDWRNRIHLVGHMSHRDLSLAMQASDGFISLSYRENFGYSLADALAAGLPVILSPGHDLAYDMPRHHDGGLAAGWLLPDDSERAAQNAIWSFAMSSAEQLRYAGLQAKSWASDVLSPERFAESLRKLSEGLTII